ncbi:hypothetical protein ALC57_06135 [Trachymyrmex cornetzi]|uniref:Uncharacterized protein n=1 Tax=Trachymyrmex cornetzi TaxID=471704 RepID=A0A195E8T2_9HYME|nr:hypothetical protein ALC57_06135 [Trachymyrmex cornetzi]
MLLRAQGESIDVYISVSDVIDHERNDSGGPVRKLLIALQCDLSAGDSRRGKKGYERGARAWDTISSP